MGEEGSAATGDRPPALLTAPVARYPSQAMASGQTGVVSVTVRVSDTGKVLSILSIEGPPVFHQTVTKAVRRLRFEPAQRSGVSSEGTARVTFVLSPPTDEDADTIVITESSEVSQETHAHGTLSREELVRGVGNDLAEATAAIPGVVVGRGSADSSKPIIRGQSERRLLVLTGGLRHESQKWGADHATEVDPLAADQITVVKGAAGVRYGPDAIGGVILLEPAPLSVTESASGKVISGVESNGRRGLFGGRVEAALPGVADIAVRVEGNLARGATLATPTYLLGNTASGQWNLGATVQGAIGQGLTTASYRRFQMKAGVCYCLRNSTSEDFDGQLDADAPVGSGLWSVTYDIDRPYQQVSHDTVMLRSTLPLGSGTLEATYGFQLNRRQEFEPARESVSGPQYDFTLRTHTVDLDFSHEPLRYGDRGRHEGSMGFAGSFQENVYSGLPLIPNHRAFSGGVYAWERLSIGHLDVTAGGRYDHQSRTSFLTDDAYTRHESRGTLDGDDCELSEDVARCPRTFNAASVSLGASIRGRDDQLGLALDLSSANRFPNGDELYMNGTAPTSPVYALGDPSLGIETVWGSSLTGHIKAKQLDAELSTYANYTQRYIYFAPEIGPDGTPAFDVTIRGAFPRFVYSPLDAWFYGVDGSVWLAPEAMVSARVSGAVVRTVDVATRDGLLLTPADRVSATLVARRPRLARITEAYAELTGLMVAQQTRVDPSADLAPAPPGYFLLSAAAGGELFLRENRVIRFGAEGHNLLNTRYREYTSLLRYYADEPGRTLRLRLSIAF